MTTNEEESTAGDPAPAPTPPRRRSLGVRLLRRLAWSVAGLVALVALLTAGAWWWLGSDHSLAFALAQTARHLPAGQTLQSRDVSGSLRAGGHIGWLRWQSDSLAVEVSDARIGWQLAPLLRRRVQLGEVHAGQLLIERRGPADSKPVEPLTQLVLPVEVELPFQIDDLRWAGPPMLQATQLKGSYRYANQQHQLEITGVDIADGHYGAQLTLQGPAPMAIDASLDGRVRALLAQDRSIGVLANASIKGTLAGAQARLAIDAHLQPVDEDSETPMQAQVQANIAPWQAQPVIDAKAQLQNVDLARLWPEAPTTLLSGSLDAGPDPVLADASQSWHMQADIRNDMAGPWDSAELPVEQLQARAGYDGTTWTLPEATLRVGGGRVDAQGSWSPAPAPWQLSATITGVQPGALHSELAGAPVTGRVKAEQRDAEVAFDLALQAQGGAGAMGLRLERAQGQGRWQNQVLDLSGLRIEADGGSLDGRLQLHIDDQAGSGRLNLVVPGGSARVEGRIKPNAGDGTVQARVDDAAALQRWIAGLPELESIFAGTTMQGNASLDATWRGGWQAVARRLQNANQPAPRGSAEPTLQATLSVPKLDLLLPGAEPGPASAVQLSAVRAEVAGSLAQATLSLKGDAATGNQKIALETRASGGIERADQWHAGIASLRLQVQDSTQPDTGPWVLELSHPLSATVRSTAGAEPVLAIEASAGAATLKGPAPGTVQIDWEPLRFSRSGGESARAFRLQSKGRLQGLPMAWAGALGGADTLDRAGFSGDLKFNGDWDINATDTLRAHARLTRESGDLSVQAGEAALVTRITSHGTGTASETTMDAAGQGASTPAGLTRAEL
ncbi:MAG TPA: translocation/assembly module TamB, partial [Variovorax sp.]